MADEFTDGYEVSYGPLLSAGRRSRRLKDHGKVRLETLYMCNMKLATSLVDV